MKTSPICWGEYLDTAPAEGEKGTERGCPSRSNERQGALERMLPLARVEPAAAGTAALRGHYQDAPHIITLLDFCLGYIETGVQTKRMHAL